MRSWPWRSWGRAWRSWGWAWRPWSGSSRARGRSGCGWTTVDKEQTSCIVVVDVDYDFVGIAVVAIGNIVKTSRRHLSKDVHPGWEPSEEERTVKVRCVLLNRLVRLDQLHSYKADSIVADIITICVFKNLS